MLNITPELLATHKLNASEYDKIVSLLGRTPSITELGIFSVMWSEHCSYKSSRVHLKKLPTKSKYVLLGPGENAGIIDIGGGYGVAFKIESHNHPSFIEPFQGAATGVGGILRDIFTMGARPIAVMDAIRFGPLDDPQYGKRNRRILEGVVSGISHYGNCFGVPTVGGETSFHAGYNGNPLVNVFALGLVKADEVFLGRAEGVGNPVIYVGAKTGKDGIHGATMASDEFTEESKQHRPNVQMGDPFMEKLLLEACLEAMKTGTIEGIQDMGAAGLTCSTSEMGSRAGTGMDVELMKVPQRELDMTAYEIMLSESQERMLLVAKLGREQEVFDVFKKWGLDAAVVGVVTGDGILRIRHKGELVAEIPNRALADEAPIYNRPYTVPQRNVPMEGPEFKSTDLAADLHAMLASDNLCSKRWIWEQYDYTVRTNTIAGPGYDAAIVRIKETGTSVAMALDGNGRYCYLSPREGAKLMVAEACRNVSTVGAQPIAATNNLNFGNPERPEIMAQLVEAIEGMSEACEFFETPITGGNVSLYNETLGEGILPSPVLGIVGLMKTEAPVKNTFPKAGLDVLLLGGIGSTDLTHFGGTEYANTILKSLWGMPPALDMAEEKKVQTAIRQIVGEGLAESSHDVSDGGLAIALAECSFGGIGCEVELVSNLRPEFTLFHEGPSRILVSTSQAEKVMKLGKELGVEVTRIGSTIEEGFVVKGLLNLRLSELRRSWETALETKLHA